MNRKLMQVSAASALTLTLVLWGCDNLGEVMGPARATAPRGDVVSIDTTTSDSTHYTLVANASSFTYTTSKDIGPLGGYLEVGNYSITVPAGAVVLPTTFSLTIQGDGYYSTSLHATRKGLDGSTVDVGKDGFLVPVGITLPYDSRKYRDPSVLKIVWLKKDTYSGEVEALPTVANKRTERVAASVGHFSQYALASTRDEETAF
jgi:hypothetical protein